MNNSHLFIRTFVGISLLILWLSAPKFVHAADCGSTVTVVRGDNLTHIAARCGTTVEALVLINHLRDPDLIIIGQQLIIFNIPPAPSGYEMVGIINTNYLEPRCIAANVELAGQLPIDCSVIVIGDLTQEESTLPFWGEADVFAHCVYSGEATFEAMRIWGDEQLHDGKMCPYPVSAEQ